MAILSMISYCLHSRCRSYQEPSKSRTRCSRAVISMCLHSHEPENTSSSSCPKGEKKAEAKKWSEVVSGGVGKFGEEVKERLRPKQKGDWKDLTLMSLSFAIYVYISQRLVGAYYVWVFMPKQLW